MDDPCVYSQACQASPESGGSSVTPVSANVVRRYHTRQWTARQARLLMRYWWCSHSPAQRAPACRLGFGHRCGHEGHLNPRDDQKHQPDELDTRAALQPGASWCEGGVWEAIGELARDAIGDVGTEDTAAR